MARVGRFVSDPNGAYCHIVLDSREKIIVNHDRGGFKGGHVTVELSKLFGLSSKRLFSCDLDTAEGQAALARITAGAAQGSAGATPLGAFVEHIKSCRSADEVAARCAAVTAGR